jgi:hypothetical protein
MVELWLFGPLAVIALASAAVAAFSGSVRSGTAGLGSCAIAVALLCVLHGAADLGWAVVVVFGGGLATALALVGAAVAPPAAATAVGGRAGWWLAALVSAALFGALGWLMWPRHALPDAASEPALVPPYPTLSDPLVLLVAVLLTASMAAVVVLTRPQRGRGTGTVSEGDEP